MTDSPHGACPPPGNRAGTRTRSPRTNPRSNTTTKSFLRHNSMRRPASASRTSGRSAVGLRPIPDPDALARRAQNLAEKPKRKISTPRRALDRLRSYRDDLLPGEGRSLGSDLFVDLVPSSCWFTNVRSCVIPKDWERLRRVVTNRSGERCEACGRRADSSTGTRLEAHERLDLRQTSRVQTLSRLICLCNQCHTVTHFGLAQIKAQAAEALAPCAPSPA